MTTTLSQTGAKSIYVFGEALMDCIAHRDGRLTPHKGGSPYNLARAAALRGADVNFISPLSTDHFGDDMRAQFALDGVKTLMPASRLPTSLAVVQIKNGQPSYGFYREGIADRDYAVEDILRLLQTRVPGVLHTGSLHFIPPEHQKVIAVLQGAKKLGWTISIDVNLRPQVAENVPAYISAVRKIVALADWLKASDEDLALLGFANPKCSQSDVIAKHFTAQGISRLALTFGADGAWLQVDGQVAAQAAPVVAVVDTVGAGDTFWGNCLGDWVLQPENADSRVSTTLSQAMLAAAMNCMHEGCQPPPFVTTSDS
ncbi:MAG TPA: PfkB family carbohydrate kinase [Burkholderiaceae bacterium]|nr:PfkB family carbohydrate kinase [Burkholderiaceae bacterium]